MINRFLPAPSLENMDGVACAAVADFATYEPYTWCGTEIALEDESRFYVVLAFTPGPSLPDENVNPPGWMVVERDKRDMVLCEPCNEMRLCPDSS